MKRKQWVAPIIVGSILLSNSMAMSGITPIIGAYLFSEYLYSENPEYRYDFGATDIFDTADNPITVTAESLTTSDVYILESDDPLDPNGIDGYYFGRQVIDSVLGTPVLTQLKISATNGTDTVVAFTNNLPSDQEKLGAALILDIDDSLSPTITWQSVDNADSYKIRLYDGHFTSNIFSSASSTETSYTIPDNILSSGNTYTLRVTATDKGITGDGPILSRSSTFSTLNYGVMEINTGSALTNSGTLINSGEFVNDGTILGSGKYLQTAGQGTNTGTITQGSIDIQGGSFTADGTITVDIFSNSGSLTGEGTINGDFENSGTTNPGSSPENIDN